VLQLSDTPIHVPSAGYLRSIPLFGGLGEDGCDLLCTGAQALQVSDGETVYTEGGTAEALYVIWEGRVALRRRTPRGSVIVNHLDAGESFGEQELLDMLPRHCTVVGAGEATVFTIFTLNAARQMSRRLRQIDTDLIELRAQLP
jgi:CRP-like cAMP-binding protein